MSQGQLLATSQSIVRLNLGFNDITADGCDTLARGLLTNTSLTALNLSYNPIGDEGCFGLSAWIKSSAVIREFHVDHCRISDDGIGALVDALAATPSPVASLDLGGNRFGTEAVLEIWSLVPALPHLEHLAVRACDIRPAEIAELAPLLPQASSLRTLGLQPLKASITLTDFSQTSEATRLPTEARLFSPSKSPAPA